MKTKLTITPEDGKNASGFYYDRNCLLATVLKRYFPSCNPSVGGMTINFNGNFSNSIDIPLEVRKKIHEVYPSTENKPIVKRSFSVVLDIPENILALKKS